MLDHSRGKSVRSAQHRHIVLESTHFEQSKFIDWVSFLGFEHANGGDVLAGA